MSVKGPHPGRAFDRLGVFGVLLLSAVCVADRVVAAEAVCSRPSTLYCVDWEGYQYPSSTGGWCFNKPWPPVDGCNYNRQNVVQCAGEGFNSTCAAKFSIAPGANDSEWSGRSFPEQNGRVFNRFYYKVSSDWTWSNVENKVIYLNFGSEDEWRANISFRPWTPKCTGRAYDPNGGECTNPSGAIGINVLYPGSNSKHDYFQNVGPYYNQPFRIQRDTWYCVEWAVTPNTPGSYPHNGTNGRIEMWIDGNKVLDHQNINVRGSSTKGIRQLFLSAYHNGPTNHPMIHAFYDRIVVSTEYIGCADSAPPSSAPSNVEGLRRTDKR